MSDRTDARTWMHRAIFVAVGFWIIVFKLAPLNMQPAGFAGPDLLLVITLVWVARKPQYLPLPVIVAFFLMADFLFMRPPGLCTALVVILTETIRRQHRDFRTMTLFAEWTAMGVGVVAITLANALILAIVMIPQPPLTLVATEMVTTILVYPLVALIAQLVFGISKTAPGDTGRRGQLA